MKKVTLKVGIFALIWMLALAGCPAPDSSPAGTVATPTASPQGGNFAAPVSVALSCATGGAAIYYTLNNSTPTTGSTLYTGTAISIAATATLKAIAVKNGMNDSAVMTAAYIIGNPQWETAAMPAAEPQGGDFTGSVSVTLSCNTGGAAIYYTLDGGNPASDGILYTTAITISATTTIKAIAVKAGMNNSAMLTVEYTINIPVPETVATPTASPGSGSFSVSETVSLSCITSGADINYTLDGGNPTTSSSLYTSAITITETTTIKAFAIKSGMTDSEILTEEYIINTVTLVAPTLTIDGVLITIPVPAGGTNTINVSAVVSNGVIADFADPDGVLVGKIVNLQLSAAVGQNNRINYTAISAIEQAFTSKGVATVSSDTIGGAIPVFGTTSYTNGSINDDLALLASKATAQDTIIKIVNDIRALYNNGNPILQVYSPMQLTGDIWCSHLDRIQTTQGNIYADETLRLWEYGRKVALASFLAAYAKCGFNLDGNNNFLPKPGVYNEGELPLEINDTASSWDIYMLFAGYHDAGKLNNLTELTATNITVAGLNATGLYDTNNQPLNTFPYKVDGQIVGFMSQKFKAFENVYENQGNLSLPVIPSGFHIKNFATKSQISGTSIYADGACFFQYAPGVIQSDGAVKFMQVDTLGPLITANAKYLDLRDLTPTQTRFIRNTASPADEISFSSPAATPRDNDDRFFLKYDIGYANDPNDSGITKFIGRTADGFNSYQSSTRNNNIYGVLDLQDWTGGNPPQNKTSDQLDCWTAGDFNALLGE